MKANVHITARERGKIIDRREGHNVFIDFGRQWLAELIAASSFDPDVPERNERIKYMGIGIGGVGQNASSAFAAPWSVSYPVGSDPIGTSGTEYNDDFPFINGTAITTLERPIRITGGSTAYPGVGGDQWRTDSANQNIVVTSPTSTSRRIHAFLDGSVGHVVYGSFDPAPISEAGLFLGDLTAYGTPFAPLVAYHSFDTIEISSIVELEFAWTISF